MKIILISLLSLLLAACATTIPQNKVTTAEQKKLLLTVDDPLPQRPANFSEIFDTKAKSARIILTGEPDARNYRGAKKQLMAQLSQSANLRLGKLSGVEVKSDLSEALKKERMISETSGNEIGRQDIDFALYMGISAYTSDKSAEKKEKMFSDGYYYDCGVEAELYGWFRLVEIPSMRVIQQVEFDESDSDSEDLDGSRGCYGRVYENLFTEVHKEIARSAACDGVEKIKSHLKPTGYVLDKNVFNKALTYKISLTSLQGVEKGDDIELSHIKNGESYAQGEIVKVTATYSLIRLTKKAENETIYENDFAQAVSNSTFGLSCLF